MKLTQNRSFKIALEITGTGGMEYPFYTSKILEFRNLELLHAILTCATPIQYVAPWHYEKRTQEFISKISTVETTLSECDGYLIKSPETEFLDPSEKSVTSYYLGLYFTKMFSMKEFAVDYFLNTTLFDQIYGSDSFICNGRKKPSFVGYERKDNLFSIWEPTGKRDHAPKALDDAYNQALGIKSINSQRPHYAMASMTYFDTKHSELQGVLRNASEGRKAHIHFDKEHLYQLYYRPICEIFDESLRRKPFDSVIDYIDGYLEIELELFGLNVEDGTDGTIRRKVKLGVPKDILGFFQYNTVNYDEGHRLSSIIDSLHIRPEEYQDDNFFMGRDGIYFRVL